MPKDPAKITQKQRLQNMNLVRNVVMAKRREEAEKKKALKSKQKIDMTVHSLEIWE